MVNLSRNKDMSGSNRNSLICYVLLFVSYPFRKDPMDKTPVFRYRPYLPPPRAVCARKGRASIHEVGVVNSYKDGVPPFRRGRL